MSDLSDARVMRAIELCREQQPGAFGVGESKAVQAADPMLAYVVDLRRGGVNASSRVRAWVPEHLRRLIAG